MKQLIVNKEDLKCNITKITEYAKKISNDNNYTIICVAKGNGYGLDLVKYAEYMRSNGIEYFAVATIEEALKLSKANITENILMLSPLNQKDELEEAIKSNIIVTVASKENAKDLMELAKKGYNIRAHIKIDTGFGRYGFLYDDYDNIITTIKELKKSIDVEGIFSHFSMPYYKNNKYTLTQFERFNKILELLDKNNIEIKLKHICNSSALLNYPQMHLNAARIGSAFLGRACSENDDIKLRKIGELQVSVAEVRTIPKNFHISYLSIYKTKKEEKIAILPIGYIEGVNLSPRTDMYRKRDHIKRALRELKNLFKDQRIKVKINGQIYNVVGTIRYVSCRCKSR